MRPTRKLALALGMIALLFQGLVLIPASSAETSEAAETVIEGDLLGSPLVRTTSAGGSEVLSPMVVGRVVDADLTLGEIQGQLAKVAKAVAPKGENSAVAVAVHHLTVPHKDGKTGPVDVEFGYVFSATTNRLVGLCFFGPTGPACGTVPDATADKGPMETAGADMGKKLDDLWEDIVETVGQVIEGGTTLYSAVRDTVDDGMEMAADALGVGKEK